MAGLATTLKFSEFLIKLEDQDAPGTYVAPCGLRSRGFNRSAATNEANVPSCPPNEDAPSWLERDTVSLSGELSGSGVVADEDYDTWDSWFEAQDSRNVEITLGARKWHGAVKLTALNLKGERGGRIEIDVTMMSDGEVVRV